MPKILFLLLYQMTKKYIYLIICLLISLVVSSCRKDDLDSLLNEPVFVYRASTLEGKCERWLYTLCSKDFMGRKTGTEYDEKTFNYLSETIAKLGYGFSVQDFQSNNGACLLKNLLVTIPGQSDSIIVIGSHFDGACLSNSITHYPAANDNASGVVTNLALLDSIAQGGIIPHFTVVCAFWDGEEVFDGTWAQGSRYYVNNCEYKELIKYYINLDSVGHDHNLYIKYKGSGMVNRALSTILSNNRLNYVPIDMNNTSGGSSDYVPFGNAGIPYLAFGDHNEDMCFNRSHSEKDVIGAISIDRIVIHVANILDLILMMR